MRLFLLVLLAYLAFAGGHLYTADDWSRFYAARSFLLRCSPELPDLPYVYGVEGSGGRIVSHFPPGLSLASLPLLTVGHLTGKLSPRYQELVERGACSVLNQVVVAWLMVLLYRLLVVTGVPSRPALRLVLAAAFGTLAFPYAKHFWAEPLQAALLVAALLQLHALRGGDTRVRRYLLFSAALAYAFVVKYETVVPAAVLGTGLMGAAPRGIRRFSALIGPWVIAGALIAAYNFWRFGSFLDLGYGGMVLPPQAGEGVAQAAFVPSPADMARRALLLFVSPGQGLFVFVPLSVVAFLWAVRPTGHPVLRIGYAAGFAGAALYVVLDRSSTWCWGPRYLFTSMILWWPALAGVSARMRGLVTVLGGIGVVVALLGVLVNFHDAIEEIKTSRSFGGWEWVSHVQTEPELSPVVWHARLLVPYATRTIRDATDPLRPQRAPVVWRHRHLDVLWLTMWAGGMSPLVLMIPALLLGGAARQYGALRRGLT